MDIRNVKELVQRGTLEEGDRVFFQTDDWGAWYTVGKRQLSSVPEYNDEPFARAFGFDSDSPKTSELASAVYGYKSTYRSFWPYSKENDYAALTQMVLVLLVKLNQITGCKTANVEGNEMCLEKLKKIIDDAEEDDC